MPAPTRQAPYRTEATATIFSKGIVGVYTDTEVDDLLSKLPTGGEGSADLSNYYDKPEVDALLSALPEGGGGTVYEQDVEPAGGVYRNGDLWLSTPTAGEVSPSPTAGVTGEELEQLQKAVIAALEPKLPQSGLTEPEVVAIVRKVMAGGKDPPPDFDWTPLVRKQGTGTIEGKLFNGTLTLRGTLVFTYSSAGTYTTVATLPTKFPKPIASYQSVVTGKENGVAFRFVSVELAQNGDLNIVACGGKVTHITFDGVTAQLA